MYKFHKVAMILLVLFMSTSAVWGANDPPCKYPPFLGKSAVIPPHIIVVLDYSGSMASKPFGFPNIYKRNFDYSGQFKNDMYYFYNTAREYFEEVAPWSEGKPEVVPDKKWIRGNILNWVTYMQRITILKLVLQGDEEYIVDGPDNQGYVVVKMIKRNKTKTFEWNNGNCENCGLKIEYSGGDVRWDTYYGEDGNPHIGGYVTLYFKKKTSKGWIKEYWAKNAPARIRKRYEETRGVFAEVQDKDADGVVDPDAPSWSVITYQSLWYNNNNYAVLRIRKEKDINVLRSSLNDARAEGGTPTVFGVRKAKEVLQHSSCDPASDIYYEYINGIPMGLWCRRVYVLLLTDGDWNTGGDPLPYVYPSRIEDQRSDLAHNQHLNYFTMYMFGSGGGKNSQRWIALYGGFKDVDNNQKPGSYSSSLPDSKHVDFYCRSQPIDRDEWDNDANCLPDQYYEVYNAEQMKDAFSAIMEKIKVDVASASAAPTTPVTSKGTGMIFQAVFMPTYKDTATGEDRYWLGEIRELFVDHHGNIREDSDNDKKLDLRNDRVITYYFDPNEQIVKVATYQDVNGNGVIDSSELSTEATKSIFMLNSIWNASTWLNSVSPAQRRIYYLDDGTHLKSFVSSEADVLAPLFGMNSRRADSLINYIRGVDYPGIYRKRSINGIVWKLADIIHSTPTYLATPMERYDILYGDESYREYYRQYRNKRGVLFVGANDGMLHAFNAGVFRELDGTYTIGEVVNNYPSYQLGEEMWSIIPHNLLPHLRWLWRKDYEVCHVYYVDGKPKLTDLKIFPNDRTHPEGWGTVLAVGFNFGGDTITADGTTYRSAYLVLDVTDPAHPVPMMEFTKPDLGFTTTYPAFARVDSTWFMLVGSGPNKLSGESDQSASFYVVKEDGTDYKFDGFDNNYNAFVGSPVSVDINLDYDVDYIYFGVNYQASGGQWRGQLYRLDTNGDANPNNWSLFKVIEVPAPITAPPSVSVDEKGRIWVFFGTGKYFGALDAVDSSTNYIIGVKDMDNSTSLSNLLDVTNATLEVTSSGDSMYLGSSSYSFKDFEDYVEGFDGWYIRLPRGERVLEKGAVLGGAVFMTTYSPMAQTEGNPCDAGNVAFGGGHLFVLYYKTGTAHTKHMLGVESGVALKSVATGGMPSSPEIHVNEKGDVTVTVQSATGTVEQYNVSTPFSIKSGVKLWKGSF